jgi:hypothetical protein
MTNVTHTFLIISGIEFLFAIHRWQRDNLVLHLPCLPEYVRQTFFISHRLKDWSAYK